VSFVNPLEPASSRRRSASAAAAAASPRGEREGEQERAHQAMLPPATRGHEPDLGRPPGFGRFNAKTSKRNLKKEPP
jgi:hypothetical protein